ncbi:Conserved_hypothetical protein [Hexamita inflata]|uniref:Leucine rich repeat protein n=1 Tax=Hexamita inflata TaxID=28002 RepID=A0AA86NGL1_9EUKA|nr:Conserved hypothetical protein [Hexamita inflata]
MQCYNNYDNKIIRQFQNKVSNNFLQIINQKLSTLHFLNILDIKELVLFQCKNFKLQTVPENIQKLFISDCQLKRININHLQELNELELSQNKIKNLKGIQMLKYLRLLNLEDNKISTIEQIKQLQCIEQLNMNGNLINDIQPICTLTRLRKLYLSQNKIKSINLMQRLYNLQELELRNNQINNINAIGHLTQLQVLNIAENNITEIYALQQLYQLRVLQINDNKVVHVQALQHLIGLTHFEAENNCIIDQKILENHPNYKYYCIRLQTVPTKEQIKMSIIYKCISDQYYSILAIKKKQKQLQIKQTQYKLKCQQSMQTAANNELQFVRKTISIIQQLDLDNYQ